MVKLLLLVAFMANLFLLVLSTETRSSARAVSYIGPPVPCPRQKAPTCKVNEVWSTCPIAVCVPKTCDEVGFPVPCPDFLPNGKCPVPPACICREGYVRNRVNICVPMSHCPSCGGDSNAVSGCGTNCNRLCSNYNKKPPGACIQACQYNACDCRPGFVYDEITEKCVFPSKCTLLTCNVKHEVYDPCPPPYPSHTCGVDDTEIACLPSLQPGDPDCPPPRCRCRDGYFRDNFGQCVRSEDCPFCTGLNEIYDPCPAPCPPQKCGVNIALILCAKPPELGDPECQPGCRCINNYVKNYTGVCIPRDQCPTCSNLNEVYDPCIDPCPRHRCDVDDRLIDCVPPPQLGDKNCVAGCRCADGYYLNGLGKCVTRDECPTCPNPNEVYDLCIAPCPPRRCDVDDRLIRCAAPPQLGDESCVAGCRCADGYYRNNNGICVTRDQCPPKCKGKHEVFNECIEGDCLPKTCDELGTSIACPRIDPRNCTKGCLCEEGYVRGKNNACIPKAQCPSCGGDPNAVSGCGVNCNKRCSDIGKEPGACIEICYENACDCKEGYYYNNETRKCVRPEQCTPKCKANEIFSDCIEDNCEPRNCSQVGFGFPLNCKIEDRDRCTPGCLCKVGYVKNDKEVCIPARDCPSCGGDPNAQSGCGKNCGRLCSNYMQTGVVCTLECKLNSCDCKKDYVYDNNTMKCVLPKDCTPICKKNEVYSECINGGCSRKNCSQTGPVPCIKLNPKACIKGCLCKDGYLREDTGECVPKNKCKPKCNLPNEYYEPCDYNCPPNTCESLDRAYVCPIREGDSCIGQCKCKPGYYRDKKGQCLTEEQCRKCTGPNEFYSCGGACDTTCSTLNQTCPIVNIKCNEMCYCEDGYARAKNGTCIPIQDCDQPQCKNNETYVECPAWTCKPKTCKDVGYPIPCPFLAAGSKCPEKPGCVCVNDYVKNDNGECISVKECPFCGGDPNAVSGCGTNCGKKCEDLGKGPGVCPFICLFNACDCKDGYYYDGKKEKCVLAFECTGVCSGKNEVFEDCTNPTCEAKKCSELGFPLNCTYVPECNKGCVCKPGYVRNAKDVCIPKKRCRSCGGDKHAESGCGQNCLKKCYDFQNPDKPKPCTKICRVNACDCKDGYYLDENTKTCVRSKKCTFPCPENEVLDNCVNGRCGYRNCSELDGPMLCIDPMKCNKGCTCKKNYLRDDETGLCVPQDKCPKKCTKVNEVYVKCPRNCPPQTCESIGRIYDCPMIKTDKSDCVGECRCKAGFYKNLAGECISKDECLQCKGEHNYFSCGPSCDNVCSDIDKQSKNNCLIKNKKCVSQCYCEDGYARDSNGTCIPVCDCEPSDSGCSVPINSTEAVANFQTGNTELTIQLMKEYLETRPDENVMFSTLSILIASAQLAYRAIDDSLIQFLDFFNLNCKKEIGIVFPILLKSLKDPKNVTFVIENKFYANQEENPLTEQYVRDAKIIFDAEAENIDFKQNVAAAETINEWVSDKTRGLITDLVKPEMLSALTRLAIFNVLYFKGNWVHPFDEKKTKPAQFCLNDEESVMLPTMNQINTFQYGENSNLEAKITVLPYVGGQFKLVIMLPNSITGLKAMIEKLDEDTINQSLESLTFESVNVSIPLMNFKSDFSDLKIVLQKLGLTSPFEPNSDDFRCIIKNNEPLTITDFIQKTALIVNERGTEATAVTGITVGTTSVMIPPKTRQFNWNRPGAFILLGGKTILFSGYYNGAK